MADVPVFVVTGTRGSYSDTEWWIVAVAEDREQAEAIVAELRTEWRAVIRAAVAAGFDEIAFEHIDATTNDASGTTRMIATGRMYSAIGERSNAIDGADRLARLDRRAVAHEVWALPLSEEINGWDDKALDSWLDDRDHPVYAIEETTMRKTLDALMPSRW